MSKFHKSGSSQLGKQLQKMYQQRTAAGETIKTKPMHLIFGPMGSGKTTFIWKKGCNAPAFKYSNHSNPDAVLAYLKIKIDDFHPDFLNYPTPRGKGKIVLEDYDASDKEFNQLLQKFAMTGFEVFVTTQDNIFKTLTKAQQGWALGYFKVYQVDYPNFESRLITDRNWGTKFKDRESDLARGSF